MLFKKLKILLTIHKGPILPIIWMLKNLKDYWRKIDSKINNIEDFWEANGIVTMIIDDQSFLLEGEHGKVKCLMDDRSMFDNLAPSSHIVVRGRMILTNNKEFGLKVIHFHPYSEDYQFRKNMKRYDDIMNQLKYRKELLPLVKQIHLQRDPEVVFHIGFILVSCKPDEPEILKTSFRERCIGKLEVCHMDNDDPHSLVESIKYFRDSNADLICLLCTNMNSNTVFELSSIRNIEFLSHNRKRVPYLLTVLPDHTQLALMEPATAVLSNKIIYGIDKCIDYIGHIQMTLLDRVERAIANGKRILIDFLNKRKTKILKYRQYFNHLDYTYPILEAKYKIIRWLDLQRLILWKMHCEIIDKTLGPIAKIVIDRMKPIITSRCPVDTTHSDKPKVDTTDTSISEPMTLSIHDVEPGQKIENKMISMQDHKYDINYGDEDF